MSTATDRLAAERLRELLDYDPTAGTFTWRQRRGGKATNGIEAGGRHRGNYRRIKVDGHRYLAHRLAWFYVHGVWPSVGIDHFDTDPSNNRFANLREATMSENRQNLRRAVRGSAGLLGTWRSGNKWCAAIKLHGKRIHLGTFATTEAAHAAYVSAKRSLHPFGTL